MLAMLYLFLHSCLLYIFPFLNEHDVTSKIRSRCSFIHSFMVVLLSVNKVSCLLVTGELAVA